MKTNKTKKLVSFVTAFGLLCSGLSVFADNFENVQVENSAPTENIQTLSTVGAFKVEAAIDIVNGSISFNRTSADAGDTVTVTATPAPLYSLSSITVNGQPIIGQSFQMPASDVTVKAIFAKTSYTLSTDVTVNGTLTVDKTTAKVGETVTVTATANDHYKLEAIKANGVEILGNTFMMPQADVMVSAKFARSDFDVIVDATLQNGSVSVNKLTAEKGEPVTVTATANPKYHLVSILMNGREISGNTFNMPEENANVSAKFEADTYQIKVDNDIDGGKVSVSKTAAAPGETVFLIANPESGYKLSSLYVNSDRISGTSFIMPEKNVRISATFEINRVRKRLRASVKSGSTSIKTASANIKSEDEITLDIVPNGGVLSAMDLQDGDTIAKIGIPKRDGFNFIGWYADEALSYKYDANTVLNENMTIYAGWERENGINSTAVATLPSNYANGGTGVIEMTIGDTAVNLYGRYYKSDAAPLIRNNRTMLPTRLVAEALGAEVTWDAASKSVKITKNGNEIIILVGASAAYVNGTMVALDAPAFIENNRTYTPLKFIAENLGAEVAWNSSTRTVTIS